METKQWSEGQCGRPEFCINLRRLTNEKQDRCQWEGNVEEKGKTRVCGLPQALLCSWFWPEMAKSARTNLVGSRPGALIAFPGYGGGFSIGNASDYMWHAEVATLFRLSSHFMVNEGYRQFQ